MQQNGPEAIAEHYTGMHNPAGASCLPLCALGAAPRINISAQRPSRLLELGFVERVHSLDPTPSFSHDKISIETLGK
jgi:hypothetical protein